MCVCVYVKTKNILVRNNGKKERGQLVLTYICMCADMCEFWMYKSLNQAHC